LTVSREDDQLAVLLLGPRSHDHPLTRIVEDGEPSKSSSRASALLLPPASSSLIETRRGSADFLKKLAMPAFEGVKGTFVGLGPATVLRPSPYAYFFVRNFPRAVRRGTMVDFA
jgi:hypothetical protein